MRAAAVEKVDYGALVAALLTAPFAVTALIALPAVLTEGVDYGSLYASLVFLAISSVYLGGICYLLLGIPLVLLKLTPADTRPIRFLLICCLANMPSPIILYPWLVWIGGAWGPAIAFALYCWIIGFVFAALWGGMAGVLYHVFRRVIAKATQLTRRKDLP